MITKKLLLAALAATSIIFPAAIQAQHFQIEIGDRPYYRHGDRYWDNDWEMIWVPGHWSHHHQQWVHGHYVRGHHRHYGDRYHDDHRDDYRRY
jgi:hypothetical protein